jgi:hypothetical protein
MLRPERLVAVVSLPDGVVINKWFRGAAPRYVKGGWLVFRQPGELDGYPDHTLYAAPFDVDRLDVTGQPRALQEEVLYNEGGSEASAFDVAVESGALLYVPPRPRVEAAELVWLDRQGQPKPLGFGRQDFLNPTLDPEERRVAVQILKGQQGSLQVYNLAPPSSIPLAPSHNVRGQMAWSRNGKWLLFPSRLPQGVPRLHRVPATGGAPEQLGSPAGDQGYDNSPSVLDNDVLFHRQIAGGLVALFKVSLNPPWNAEKYLSGSGAFQLANPRIHPRGLFVAYESTKYGADTQVRLCLYNTPERCVEFSGTKPEWSPDGSALYYRAEGAVLRVPVSPQSVDKLPELGTAQQVLDLNRLGADPEFNYAVYGPSRDGQRFLAVKRPKPPREEDQLFYVSNWIETLPREMPGWLVMNAAHVGMLAVILAVIFGGLYLYLRKR